MGMPVAGIASFHMCPMLTPGVPPIPHVGGPVAAPSCPTALFGKKPAVGMGSTAVCVGPPDSVVKGSATVMAGKKPVSRIMDSCAHGGMIMAPGCPTVLIGG
jgi:uncharacterized Zn-binding protein involved in type VI secretion|tara:strand:+ start:22 stop:327 length:306 start_codon:yes stop_codon:yes gene_type:complete